MRYFKYVSHKLAKDIVYTTQRHIFHQLRLFIHKPLSSIIFCFSWNYARNFSKIWMKVRTTIAAWWSCWRNMVWHQNANTTSVNKLSDTMAAPLIYSRFYTVIIHRSSWRQRPTTGQMTNQPSRESHCKIHSLIRASIEIWIFVFYSPLAN